MTDEQCHPEEGIYNMVNEEEWKIHMTSDGRIEEDYQLRKVRFQSVIGVYVRRNLPVPEIISPVISHVKMMSYIF